MGNSRMLKFDSNGIPLSAWAGVSCTESGSGNGQFNFSTDVAVDEINNFVYVTDTGNNRVQNFDTSGNYLLE